MAAEKSKRHARLIQRTHVLRRFSKNRESMRVYRAFVCESRISERVGKNFKKTRAVIKARGFGRFGGDKRVKRKKVKRRGTP